MLNFGAKGDGATDNVKPFQNSLNAAGAGGIGNAIIMLASSPGPLRGGEGPGTHYPRMPRYPKNLRGLDIATCLFTNPRMCPCSTICCSTLAL